MLLIALPGCAASKAERAADEAVADYALSDYAHAQRLLRPLAEKPDGDFVLNNVRLGSAALAAYDFETAESAFLRAYEVINSVGVNNGGRSLGAALVDEKIKVWKGEPFERAMVNFYLGMIYYVRHDYGNARGAFENALFKLRDYGEGKDKSDEYRAVESNFALGYLMLAKCYQRLGRLDVARKNFDRCAELRPDLAPACDAERNQRSNLLLIVDFGYGPTKVATADGSFAGFAPTPREEGPVPRPAVVFDGRPLNLEGISSAPVDLLSLAQDRRWESIDTIRAVKDAVSYGLIGAGAYEGLRRNSEPGVALALVGAGLLLKATSQADLRFWEMLPRTTFVLPLYVPPGTHDLTIQFAAVPGLQQTWHGIAVPEQGEATYYFRMQRYNPGPFTWPPSSAPSVPGTNTAITSTTP